MEAKDLITSVAAIVGVILGIYNFLHARANDRVRLRVVPKSSSFQGTDSTGRHFYLHNTDRYNVDHPTAKPDTLAIEVVNLSKFPVTIEEVGLLRRWRKERIGLVNPVLRDGKPWPRKLEPRESVTAHFDLMNLLGSSRLNSVTHAYATTVCGTTALGGSGALREFVRIARHLA